MKSQLAFCLVLVFGFSLPMLQPSHGQGPLPEGDKGIASRYPGDKGIESDPLVLFADDFESYAEKRHLAKKWTTFYNQTQLTRQPEQVYLGKQAIEFAVPENRGMASQAGKLFREPKDTVFLRYYSKFDSSYDVMGSAHNGGGLSARMYRKDGSNGVGKRADGKNHFYVTIDHGRQKGFGDVPNPGYIGIYIYHPEQRSQWGDAFFPSGMVVPNSSQKFDFGPTFKSRADIVGVLDTWHCHELMVKANTPGKRDGRVAAWVDGKLAMDFANLRLRDVESLKMDYMQIGLFIQQMKHPGTRKWYDNVVAATTYIGPVSSN